MKTFFATFFLWFFSEYFLNKQWIFLIMKTKSLYLNFLPETKKKKKISKHFNYTTSHTTSPTFISSLSYHLFFSLLFYLIFEVWKFYFVWFFIVKIPALRTGWKSIGKKKLKKRRYREVLQIQMVFLPLKIRNKFGQINLIL